MSASPPSATRRRRRRASGRRPSMRSQIRRSAGSSVGSRSMSLRGNSRRLIGQPLPHAGRRRDVRAHDGVGLGEAPLDRRERALAHGRDLGELEALDVPQHPGDAQIRAQPRERAIEQRQLAARLGVQPGRRERLERGVVGAAVQPEDPHEPQPAQPVAHEVDRDLPEPHAQRARIAQAAEALEPGDERVLHDLLGVAAVGEQARREPEQGAGVPAIEHLAAPAVAADGPIDELRVADRVGHPEQHGAARTLRGDRHP